ncbi:MAG: hypothetical protein CHKLHMKO_00154 [Candidatus Argoarchaeum ethanivorans]|uniref:Uncharacterized protein n=1 Tax=Candidatus Argoarchaeum ethanivorans TaxID=2608793 RepID=A0A811T7I3_9EURY|nr:MAG: hypothetical protein CHKLHMKO_00154 [Candidatus Argoarchaeum ethanivorans]
MAKPNETYTEEEQERIDAVNLRQRGERPSKICKSLGRSRMWLQKWIKRYNDSEKSNEKKWFKEESRAPKNVHRRTDLEMEQLVTTVRKSLLGGTTEDTKYRCIGAVEIQFRMHERRYTQKMRCRVCQQSNALSKKKRSGSPKEEAIHQMQV